MTEREIIGGWKAALELILPDRQFIRANQNADRPDGDYATLLVFGTRPMTARAAICGELSEDETEITESHKTLLESTLSVNFYHGDVWTDANLVLASLDLDTVADSLWLHRLAHIGSSGVRSSTATVKKQREDRAQLDIQFTHLGVVQATVPAVAEVRVEAGFLVDGGEEIVTFEHSMTEEDTNG